MGVKEWFIRPKEEAKMGKERDEIYQQAQASKRYLSSRDYELADNQKTRLQEVNKEIDEYETEKRMRKEAAEAKQKEKETERKEKKESKKEKKEKKTTLGELRKGLKKVYKTRRENNTQRIAGFRGGLDMLSTPLQHNPLDVMMGGSRINSDPFAPFNMGQKKKKKNKPMDWNFNFPKI